MALLRSEGVSVIDHLPLIEASEAKARPLEEVAKRAISLFLVALKGEGLEQEIVEQLFEGYGASAFMSPKELSFIKELAPTQHDRIQFTWRYECYWVFLWALGYLDALPRPDGICDVRKAVGFLRYRNTEMFMADANLRNLDEILDEADLIYRYHWAVVNARVNDRPVPANLDKGVVMERHYAFNWIIGYMDQEWDDISTDT